MFDSVIKFRTATGDLQPSTELWQVSSFEARREEVMESVKAVTGSYPSKKMQALREGYFKIADSTTIEELVGLGQKLKRWYNIDCFQASIDRETNTAHMLFDWNNRETGKSVYVNRSGYVALSVLILDYLDLARPEGTETWHRYFLVKHYIENHQVYQKWLSNYKHKRPGRFGYRLAKEMVDYVEQVCQGLVK